MTTLIANVDVSVLGIEGFAACLSFALFCGLAVGGVFALRYRISAGFFASLCLLAPTVCLLLLMVNKSIGTGIAIAGAFSLVRFRSVPGKATDIIAVFLTMTAGLGCATGYVWLTLLFTAGACVLLFGLSYLTFFANREQELKIIIPESLSFSEEFSDLFDKYTKKCQLQKVKTVNMGSLYKLTYRVVLKDMDAQKEFMDEIRCRNGNLEVSLSVGGERESEL